MNNENINEEMFLCNVLEIKYLKNNGREVSNDPLANIDLFPAVWFSLSDYRKKIDILKEAIDKNILIMNTVLYQDNIEGVRNNR